MWSYNSTTSSDPPSNLWWLILHLNLPGMLWLSSFGFEANTLFLNKSLKWKRWEFSIFLLSVYITFALGFFAGAAVSRHCRHSEEIQGYRYMQRTTTSRNGRPRTLGCSASSLAINSTYLCVRRVASGLTMRESQKP